jgi:putative phosphoesterase
LYLVELPMRLAFISDIHANILALLDVLRDIEDQDIDKTYCLGDLVGYGPFPNQVVDTIRHHRIPTVMGNYDEGVGFSKGDCGCAYVTEEEKSNGQISIDWTTERVTSDNKEVLRKLHSEIEFNADGYKFLLVHGSPRRINEYLFEDRPEDSLRRVLEGKDVDVMLCGHTHLQYHRTIDGIHIVNDGSVGKPKDGDPRACYAIIDTEDNISVEFKRVRYPVETVAEDVIKNGLPRAYAEALRVGG